MADLTTGEVVTWLRRRARQLNAMADEIEFMFGEDNTLGRNGGPLYHGMRTTTTPDPNFNYLAVQDVADAMAGRKMRRAEIVTCIGCDPGERLDEILTEENGFERSGNGWFRYVGQTADEESVEQEDHDPFAGLNL